MEGIGQFFSSASWMRLLFDALLWVPFYFTNKNYQLPFGNVLSKLPYVLLLRDFLSFFVANPFIYFVSDLIILLLYLGWLSVYNREIARSRLVSLLISIPVLAFGVLSFLVDNLLLWSVLSQIVLVLGYIWLSISMFNISIYNTEGAEFIIENRVVFSSLFLFARLLLLFDSTGRSFFAMWFLLPLTVVPHFVIAAQYLQHFHKQFRERDEFNTGYINSLFDFMRTIGSAMNERIEVKSVLSYIIKSISRYINSDAGVVMLKDVHEGVLRVAAVEGYFPPPFPIPPVVKTKLTGVQKYFENTPIKIGETILGECAALNKPIYIRSSAEDPRMSANNQDDTLRIASIIVLPLIVNKEVFGVVSIIRRQRGMLFTETEYERSRIFVEYASLTLDSLYNYSQLLEKQEIEREVNIAATIQKKLLPSRIPKVIQGMVQAYSQPAKGVSGDYYDIIPLNKEGKFAVVVCDVAGKGVPASLIMVMIRTIIHTIGGARKNAAEVVSWINRGIAGRIDIERFATLSYLTYDPGTYHLEYSNAGHHPVLLYRAADAKIELIDSPGLPIGLERDSEYRLVEVQLLPGDTLMTYTDGIIEAMNYRGEQYDESRLREIFLRNIESSPKEIVKAVRDDVEKFVGQAKQHDDMTLIVLKA